MTSQGKNQKLPARHQALLEKLKHNEDPLSSFRLSTWVLDTTASAVALLRDGEVLLANRRWHELSHDGPWQRLHQGRADGPTLRTLQEVADAELQALTTSVRPSPRASRYQGQQGARALEVRTECVDMDRGAPGRTVLVMAHDVTEQARTEQELRQARTTLTEQEHLRALGELASGVAHDLNNTLSAMKLRLELLQKDEPFSERHRGHLDALVRIVADAGTRVRRLQDFSRQRPEPSGEEVQLANIIQEAVEIARSDIEHRARREGIALRIEVDLPQLPPVNGEEAELRYVFINLLLNARDAMPRGGTIRVRGAVDAASVVITVEDEGTGIPEENLLSIFRPFFTTKGSQGTGLGLSMAYGVMARAGGSVTAANRQQGGAVFTLTFPRVRPPAERRKRGPRSGKRQK
jgi:signal transduction histidine kinase